MDKKNANTNNSIWKQWTEQLTSHEKHHPGIKYIADAEWNCTLVFERLIDNNKSQKNGQVIPIQIIAFEQWTVDQPWKASHRD